MYDRDHYVDVKATHVHPDYSKLKNGFNDVALIELKESLSFSRTVQPACLANEHQDHYDGILKVGSILN